MNDYSTSDSEYRETNLAYMKAVLMKLFLYYSSFGDKTKVGILSHGNFLLLLKDSKILNDKISVDLADLVIRASLKKNKFFGFKDFCDIFVKLSEILYSEIPSSQSENLIKTLTTYVVPLYSSLLSQNLIPNFDVTMTPALFSILDSVKGYFSGIYKLYFPWEMNSTQNSLAIKKLSEKSLITMMTKYKIYPDIITRPLFTIIWQNLLEFPGDFVGSLPCEPIGKVLTLSKFTALLVLFANFGNFKTEVENLHEKFMFLLENMEIYSGRNEVAGGSVIVSRSTSCSASPKNLIPNNSNSLIKAFGYLKFYGPTKEITLGKMINLFKNLNIVDQHYLELVFKAKKLKNKVEYSEFCDIISKINAKVYPEDFSMTKVPDLIISSDWYKSCDSKYSEFSDKINDKTIEETLEL